jgi:hypothetical protein
MKRRQDGRVAQPSPPSNPGGRGRSRRSRSPGSRIILRRTFPDLPRRARRARSSGDFRLRPRIQWRGPRRLRTGFPVVRRGRMASSSARALASTASSQRARARRACGPEPAARLGRSPPPRQALCGGRIDPVPRHLEVPVQAIESSIPCKTRCALRADGRRLAPNSLDSSGRPPQGGGTPRRRVKTLAARAT